MQGTIVASDRTISDLASIAAAYLNSLVLTVHAYKTPIDPTPSTPLSAFTAQECTFDTYAPVSLAPTWSSPLQVEQGEYGSFSPSFGWNSPTAVGGSIAGFWVQSPTGIVHFSYELGMPINFAVGDPALSFSFEWLSWARAILA